MIPRAVKQIFDALEAQNAEYGMRVTFLELYHEDITDLLVPEKGSRKPITVMEDGKGAVFVKGLEEGIVHTADEIYKILEEGSLRKHIAEETLLNRQSNRSHSILSITVEIKECASEGVELIKCGKLNLVDLAGSENVLRSGAREVNLVYVHIFLIWFLVIDVVAFSIRFTKSPSFFGLSSALNEVNLTLRLRLWIMDL